MGRPCFVLQCRSLNMVIPTETVQNDLNDQQGKLQLFHDFRELGKTLGSLYSWRKYLQVYVTDSCEMDFVNLSFIFLFCSLNFVFLLYSLICV